MINWLKRKLQMISCLHDWKLIDRYWDWLDSNFKLRYIDIYQCRKCGKIKRVVCYP